MFNLDWLDHRLIYNLHFMWYWMTQKYPQFKLPNTHTKLSVSFGRWSSSTCSHFNSFSSTFNDAAAHQHLWWLPKMQTFFCLKNQLQLHEMLKTKREASGNNRMQSSTWWIPRLIFIPSMTLGFERVKGRRLRLGSGFHVQGAETH